MSVKSKSLLAWSLLSYITLSACSVNVDRKCSSLDGSRALPKECCTAAGGLKPELIAYGSKCSIDSAPESIKNLLASCGTQGNPGGGMMSGISGAFGQGLAAVGEQSKLALTHVSEKEGIDTDHASAKEGPTPFTPNNNTAGRNETAGTGGGANGPTPSATGIGRESHPSSGSAGGLSAGSGGTAPATLTDPNAQLGYVANPDSTYGAGGGGAGGRGRSGGGSTASGLSGMISSFMSGMPGAGGSGKETSNPNGMQRYGNSGNGGSAEAVLRSADPEDYFTRIAPGDSLFEKVQKRYEQTSLKGQIQ